MGGPRVGRLLPGTARKHGGCYLRREFDLSPVAEFSLARCDAGRGVALPAAEPRCVGQGPGMGERSPRRPGSKGPCRNREPGRRRK